MALPPRRVAITGVGVVSPLGHSLSDFHQSLLAGRSGIDILPQDFLIAPGQQVAARILDWNPAPVLKEGEAANLDRGTQFALVAANQAIAMSGVDLAACDRERIGVSWGTGMGGAHTLDAGYRQVYQKGDMRLRPLSVVMGMNNAAASNVAVRFGLKGPFANYATACSSSAMALGEAMRTILSGRADAAVAGGSEALLTPGTIAAWQALRTLAAPDKDDPTASCRPFDRKRTGLVLGEGAAVFMLEEESQARARGAKILAFLTGYGNTCDAVHMSRPDRDGQVRAMKFALAESGVGVQDIGYVNAHGTATTVGDVVECEAIGQVFGEHAARLPVSSTKSMHGHLLGGAGALEMAATMLPFLGGMLPPTAHLTEPDPACAIRHVRGAEKIEPPRAVMSNSFAFGGSNVVLIAERA